MDILNDVKKYGLSIGNTTNKMFKFNWFKKKNYYNFFILSLSDAYKDI